MDPSPPVNESNSRPIQYYQYNIPMAEQQPQQYQPINYQRSIVHQQELVQNDHGYFQNQIKQDTQINLINRPGNMKISTSAFEQPMMLNAWSQTSHEDFPPLSCGQQNKENEMSLLARIKELEATLKSQNDLIMQFQEQQAQQVQKNRSPSPRQDVPNSTTSTPVSTKPEGTRYRILAQADDDVTMDAQIQIELSDDPVPMSSLSSMNSSDNSDSDRLEICVSDENESNLERPDLEHATVSIGPNGTKIPVKVYENMSWASPSLATRKLLSMVFDRETLATHSMTGKASPAFKDQDKPIKGKLDPNAIQDIIFIVSRKCGVSPKEIRSAITTKCADENKMCKLKALKKLETSNATRTALKEILKNKTNRLNDNGWMK
ncbi:protein insensitive isoform X2 [Episyrphus balteatus]|nr:protein insensitive isoform X2 [Episyrphus balteatus]